MTSKYSICFMTGMSGGCGPLCEAFTSGNCNEPQEISLIHLIEIHGEDGAKDILDLYEEGTFK
jgi:hypothetical protein